MLNSNHFWVLNTYKMIPGVEPDLPEYEYIRSFLLFLNINGSPSRRFNILPKAARNKYRTPLRET